MGLSQVKVSQRPSVAHKHYIKKSLLIFTIEKWARCESEILSSTTLSLIIHDVPETILCLFVDTPNPKVLKISGH